MAAITVHLGEKEEVTRDESAVLADGGETEPTTFDVSGISAEVINKSHAELVKMVWLRSVVLEQLAGVTFHVQTDPQDPREVVLITNKTVAEMGSGPRWSPPTPSRAVSNKFSLLSWTTKMSAPSFSLPPGAIRYGGTCGGAEAGQTIIPPNALHTASKHVFRTTGQPVQVDRAICQYCYAQGANYATSSVQFGQCLKLAWVRQALRDGSFVSTMIYAIENANYKLDQERHPHRYFRIHDSGDFFSEEYLAAWKRIANAFAPGNKAGHAPVMFWAPSRCWATSWGVAAVNKINKSPKNFIIRPSAFHTNQPPPNLGSGWGPGSTSYHAEQAQSGLDEGDFTWNCGVYALKKGSSRTCRDAIDPDDAVGCRACWRNDDVVNYTIH